MTDYSLGQVAKLLSQPESRLRYWAQTGLIAPSVRRGGRVYFTFRDLITVKAVLELLSAGLSVQRVRRQLGSLRRFLGDKHEGLSRLRICSDGDSIVAVEDGVAYEPTSKQVVMNFAVAALSSQLVEIASIEGEETPAPSVTPAKKEGTPPNSYELFVSACGAEDQGRTRQAEALYRQALKLEPSLAAASTNLGNLLYRQGDIDGARCAYEQAIEYESDQPEARFNLANLHAHQGEVDVAIAELKRVVQLVPNFADAHYNLGVLLGRVGGRAQAQNHLERYLELDAQGLWPHRARELLAEFRA